MARSKSTIKLCSIEGCQRQARARGCCWSHYNNIKHIDLITGQPIICSIDGCDKNVYILEDAICQNHWRKLKKYGDPLGVAEKPETRLCTIEGCNNKHRSKGLCNKHYCRNRNHGSPDIVKYEYIRGTLDERFWARVEKTDNCWLWTGRISPKGYGQFDLEDRSITAHRMSWIMANGEIPEELEVNHLCHTRECMLGDNCPHRACIRIEHLEIISHAENVRKGNAGYYERKIFRPKKTYCINGHEYTLENTAQYKNSRVCRICACEKSRLYKQRQKAKRE